MLRTALLSLIPLSAAATTAAAPPPPTIDAAAYILMDQRSGQVLAESNADEHLDPASLTKLMTSLVVFEALRAGTLKLDEVATVSEHAWRTEGSRSFVEVGSQVPVEALIQGMIVQSGNDASVALAERVAGTEETFAALMNEEAKRLGLQHSLFENATGMPGPKHYSSARDIALIARALIGEFPEYYPWYSEREYTYNGITQHNRNALLWQDPSVDGLKTGHTDAARYCLAASALRDGMRLISVVMGATSDKTRAAGSRALLEYGFHFFETHRLYTADAKVTTVKVWKGDAEEVPLGLADDLYLTIPRGQYNDLAQTVDVPQRIIAPVEAHTEVGQLRFALGDEVLVQRPLRTLDPVATGSLWRRMTDAVELWLK
jgi:serine-type D-Ala-D-Ala carboxypeptidase (penicillin-binding protein 5/6)